MPLMYNGEKIKRLMWMGNVIMEAKEDSDKIIHTSAAEWAANPADLKIAADDIAVNGENSVYYAEFAGYMADDADFTVAIENASSYTSVAADQVIQYRLVDINRADVAGTKHGLYFQAKKSLPKAYAMNTSSSTTGGWPSMNLRTIMNSGEIWQMHPSALRDVMATVTNTSYGSSGTQVTSSDKLFLASYRELHATASSNTLETGDGPQFAYWASKGATDSSYASTAEMDVTNSGAAPSGRYYSFWWTRSVYPEGTSFFVNVDSSGGWNRNSPSFVCGVIPCFSVGAGPVTPTSFSFVWGQYYTVSRADVVAAWDKFHG